MSGWDAGRVYAVQDTTYHTSTSVTQPTAIERRFLDFLREFRIDYMFHYRYPSFSSLPLFMSITSQGRDRQQMRQNLLMPQYFLEVELRHLIAYDGDLAQELVSRPDQTITLVCSTFTLFYMQGLTCSTAGECGASARKTDHPDPSRDAALGKTNQNRWRTRRRPRRGARDQR